MGLIAIGGPVVPILLARNPQISTLSEVELLAGIELTVIRLDESASRRQDRDALGNLCDVARRGDARIRRLSIH
jgi:hypothetical protein